MEGNAHDKFCICPHCRYRMVKSEDVPCSMEVCPKCKRNLMRE